MDSKIRNIISLILLIILVFSCNRPDLPIDTLILEKGWKFTSTDSIQFPMPDYIDSHWSKLEPDISPKFSQNQKIYWFRTKVILPSSLYKNSYFKDSLLFSLGTFYGSDQCYLNGFPLGSNGLIANKNDVFQINIKEDSTNKQVSRNYKLAINDSRILWNQINILAVRILADSGFEAQIHKSSAISMIDLKDHIHFNVHKEAFFYESGHYTKQIELVNTLNQSFKGILSISVFDKTRRMIIFEDSNQISIEKNSNFIQLFAFKGSDTSMYRINYSFKEENSKNLIQEIQYIPEKYDF